MFYKLETGWPRRMGLRIERLTSPSPSELDRIAHAAGLKIPEPLRISPNSAAVARLNRYSMASLSTLEGVLRWERTRPLAAYRMLYLFLPQGEVEIDAVAAEQITSGVCVVHPGSTFVSISFPVPSQVLLFSFDYREAGIPPEAFENRFSSPGSLAETLHRTTYAYLRELLIFASPCGPDDAVGLHESLRGLARSMVQEDYQQQADGLVSQARDIISERAADADFTVAALVEALGTSRRSVERAFYSERSTPAMEIAEQRARLAYQLLREKPHAALDEVSRESGFRLADTMREQLKKVYGQTPRQIRAGL